MHQKQGQRQGNGCVLNIMSAVFPDGVHRSLRITGGLIEVVGEVIPRPGEDVIDARELHVFPGCIDPHVHFRCPGGEHKEDWLTGTQAAAAGGVTMVFDMPNTNPPTTSFDALRIKREQSKASIIQRKFWFGATAHNHGLIPTATAYGDVAGVKIYMGSSTGDLTLSGRQEIRHAMKIAAKCDCIVAVHAEDESLMRMREKRYGLPMSVEGHGHHRSAAVEALAVRRALELAEETMATLYLAHMSTPDAILMAHEWKKDYPFIIIEVCPHHLFLSEDRLRSDNGGLFKVNPPLRDRTMVKEVIQMLSQGMIDVIGSDHAPHTIEEKLSRSYSAIPSGMPGVQTLLPLMLELAHRGAISHEVVASLTSGKAAECFKLKGKGRLEVGADADLVLVDMQKQGRFTNASMYTKCGWTPYADLQQHARPVYTCIAGKCVYDGRGSQAVFGDRW